MVHTRKTYRQRRESNWQRQRKPGHRSTRGVAETNYGEVKKISSFSLTPTAVIKLKSLSGELNISTSELLERFARIGSHLKAFLEEVNEPIDS